MQNTELVLDDATLWSTLTKRETEVALALAAGMTNRDIALERGLSIKTVDTHRGNLLYKLQCRNNVGLCRLVIRLGLLQA